MASTKHEIKIDSRTLVYGELKQSGGDPSTLFEILEGVVERRDWENVLDNDGHIVGSFRRFLEAPPPVGCGVKAEKVLALLQVEHRYETDHDYAERMARLRTEVQKLLEAESSIEQTRNLNENGESETTSHYQTVDNTETSVKIRKKRIQIPNHDMQLAASTLINNLDHHSLVLLVSLLRSHLDE